MFALLLRTSVQWTKIAGPLFQQFRPSPTLQKNNPVIKHVRNVSWEVGDIVPDFELGKTTCALYLR